MRVLALLVGLALAAPAAGQDAADGADTGRTPLVFGYVELADDPRYEAARLEQELQGEPWGRPVAGARVAIDESKFPGIAAGVEFSLRREQVDNGHDAVATVHAMRESGVRFVLLDLPAEMAGFVAAQTQGRGVILFNVSARDDLLRQRACQAHLLHTIPSQAMRNDALAQYLVSHKWRDVLLLTGPRSSDAALADSFRRSARRQGLNIVDEREFVLGNDPRQRDKNNPMLLTAGAGYDAVYIADTWGEFARDAAYNTQRPRPVVGSAGLVPTAWHWSWNKHGARQLNNRFEKQAGRHATAYDWAAWMAVKAVVESVLRTETADFKSVVRYLYGDELVLDGFKGYRMGFRHWNGQLRQPVLLSTGNWVAARAPIRGFMHPTNYLDTLGFDPRESACRMAGD